VVNLDIIGDRVIKFNTVYGRFFWYADYHMKMRTIIFVTNNYTPYSGGVVSSIKAFAAGLRNLGNKVYIVTLDFKHAPYEKDVIRLYCPLRFTYKNNPMAVSWHTKQALEQLFLFLKPDIVHSQHPFLLGSAAQIVCKRLHIPLVFTHHTQYDQYLHYLPITQKLTKPVVNQLVVNFCNKVDLVIAPSSAIKKQLEQQRIKSPIYVLPSPLLPVFADNMPQFELKEESEKKQLLYVGRFTEEKNITFLLDVVKQLGDEFSLQLVGYGYYRQPLEDYAYKELCLTKEQVQFIHKPSKKIIAELYKQADLFIFASTTETQGIVLVEAMAAGTPVVALNGPGQNDIIEEGKNGFLVENRSQMVRRIKEVYADRYLFEKLQYGAWKTSRSYRVSYLADQLFCCYSKFLHLIPAGEEREIIAG